jgi:hypothetical protein
VSAEPLDLVPIRSAAPELSYAAEVLPTLCDEIEHLRSELAQAKDWARMSRRERERLGAQVRGCADLRDQLRSEGQDEVANRLHSALRPE